MRDQNTENCSPLYRVGGQAGGREGGDEGGGGGEGGGGWKGAAARLAPPPHPWRLRSGHNTAATLQGKLSPVWQGYGRDVLYRQLVQASPPVPGPRQAGDRNTESLCCIIYFSSRQSWSGSSAD